MTELEGRGTAPQWMWVPFRFAAFALAVLLVVAVYRTIHLFRAVKQGRLATSTTQMFVVPGRRVIPRDAGHGEPAELLAWTQSLESGSWQSRLTAFRVQGADVIWQSKAFNVGAAEGANACLVGSVVVVSAPNGALSGLEPGGGSPLWRVAHGQPVYACCTLPEQPLTSGPPTNLVLEGPPGTFHQLDGQGGTRVVERPATCTPVPSTCKDCPTRSMQKVSPVDPFVVPDAYIGQWFAREGTQDRIVLGTRASVPLVGLWRDGTLVWHVATEKASPAGRPTADLDGDAFVMTYRTSDLVDRVRLVKLDDGAVVWDVALASPDTEPGSVDVTLMRAFVVVTHGSIATVLNREDGGLATVLGGATSSLREGTDGSVD